MKYWYKKPHASLADYVRTVLLLEHSDDSVESAVPLVTSGMPTVFWRENKATLFGKSLPAEYLKDGGVAYFMMPFMLAPLFDIDVRKLMSAPVEFDVSSIEDFLLQKLEANRKHCEIIKYTTDQIMFDPRPEILKKLGISERTLQRVFKKFVGITPVQYRRICQFEQSFTQLRSKDFDTLAAVAYENGFADQSHFIRSFKEFSETTPNEYLKGGLAQKK